MSTRTILLIAFYALAAAFGVSAANAQTVVLSNAGVSGSDAFTSGGYAVTLSSCVFSSGAVGGTQTSGACSSATTGTDELKVTASGRGGLQFELYNPTSNVIASAAAGNQSDITFTFNIADASGSTAAVTSLSAAIAGTESVTSPANTDLSKITLGVSGTANNDPYSLSFPSLNAYNAASGSETIPASNVLSITYDLRVGQRGEQAGQVLSLTNVATILYPTPEPASTAIFAGGAAVVCAVRRRARRKLAVRA